MDLTPRLLTDDVEFREVRRGYDPNEVDDFLERVAGAVDQLQRQLAEARARAADAEARRAESPPPPAPEEQAGVEEIQRTLVMAQRTADAALREAREEAARLTSESKVAAARLVIDAEEEARRRSEEAHEALGQEIEALGSVREALRNDVVILERHLSEQRVQLRASVAELQRLLDDPSLFQTPPPEGLSEVDVPARPPAASAPEPPQPAPDDGPGGSPADDVAPAGPEPVVVDAAPATAPVDGSPDAGSAPPEDDPGAGDDGEPAADTEDAFLAELRKAMTDDEPLGPRNAPEEPHPDRGADETDADAARPRPRFGRRR